MTLSETKEGKSYFIENISNDCDLKRRILDIGIIKGSKIERLFSSPLGEPVAYKIRGAVMALRKNITDKIFVSEVGVKNGAHK